MLTLDDYLADQLHDPNFRTHFINEMAEHVRAVTALFACQMPLIQSRLIFPCQTSKSYLNRLFELAPPPTKCYIDKC